MSAAHADGFLSVFCALIFIVTSPLFSGKRRALLSLAVERAADGDLHGRRVIRAAGIVKIGRIHIPVQLIAVRTGSRNVFTSLNARDPFILDAHLCGISVCSLSGYADLPEPAVGRYVYIRILLVDGVIRKLVLGCFVGGECSRPCRRPFSASGQQRKEHAQSQQQSRILFS